jgi:hypothetical protein
MGLVRPPLIELRQYVVAPGKRDRLIELFATQFVAAQNALGLPILGYFTVPTDPDRLVWLRGFDSMQTRPDRLGAFYGGPVWAQFGPETISLVSEYGNVQLLREAFPGSGIAFPRDTGADRLIAVTYSLRAPPHEAFAAARQALSALPEGHLIGTYITAPTPNNFPALPIREGEHLFTWFARWPAGPHPTIKEDDFAPFLATPPERLVLLPPT